MRDSYSVEFKELGLVLQEWKVWHFFDTLAVSRGRYCDRIHKKAHKCFAAPRCLVVGGCNRQQQQQQLDRNSDSCLDGFNCGLAES